MKISQKEIIWIAFFIAGFGSAAAIGMRDWLPFITALVVFVALVVTGYSIREEGIEITVKRKK